MLKVNEILWKLPKNNRLQICLYVENFFISYRHLDLKFVEKKKQKESIDIVENLTQKNGSTFSTNKTSMIHFTKIACPPSLELRFESMRLQKSNTAGYIVYCLTQK